MYIKNEIAYAGEQPQRIVVSGVRPLEGYKLWLRFNSGEKKIFEFTPELLATPAFSPLKDPELFNSVYIDYGVTSWNDGAIDIAPEYLYEHSTPLDD